MKVLKAIKFDKNERVLQELVERCQMAASFFREDRLGMSPNDMEDNGLRVVQRLRAGGSWETKHFDEAICEVKLALSRIQKTEAHSCFPEELKRQYLDNLKVSLGMLQSWRSLVNEEEVIVDSNDLS